MDPTWELTAMGGGLIGGKLDFDDGQAEIQAGPAFDIMVGFRPYSDEGRVLIVSYTRGFNSMNITVNTPPGVFTGVPIDIGFVHIGGEVDGKVNRWIHPFFGLTIGATHYTTKISGSRNTSWFFSGGAHGGVKVPITDLVGLRFQGRFLGTVVTSSRQFICGGGTCYGSISNITGPLQGELSAGVYFTF